MKKLLFIAAFLPVFCWGQDSYVSTFISPQTITLLRVSSVDNSIVKSSYDTTVLYKGNDTCAHQFAKKDLRKDNGLQTCLVNHGPEGCFDTWLHEDQICTKCLKDINIQEHRRVEYVKTTEEMAQEMNDQEYEVAKEKLKKLRP